MRKTVSAKTVLAKAVSKKTLAHRLLSPVLWTALIVTSSLGLSACGGGEHEVKAVDRVDEAAELARAKAPPAEDMKFPEVAAVAVAAPEVDTAAAEVVATDAPAAEAAPADLAVNVGAELYNKQCVACHATGLLGSPKYGDAAAWAPRIEKGVETLTLHSAKGFNQMPAQAYNGVTEVEIRAAVEYMIAAAS